MACTGLRSGLRGVPTMPRNSCRRLRCVRGRARKRSQRMRVPGYFRLSITPSLAVIVNGSAGARRPSIPGMRERRSSHARIRCPPSLRLRTFVERLKLCRKNSAQWSGLRMQKGSRYGRLDRHWNGLLGPLLPAFGGGGKGFERSSRRIDHRGSNGDEL